MKEFLITVNGKTYEVQVEEIGESAVAPIPAAPVPAVKVAPIPAAIPKADVKPVSVSAGAKGKTEIQCPMPGSILRINVSVGDTVKSGDVLCILEAMKMENEIKSPSDGVIATVNTSKGTNVNAGDLLFTMN